jgi:hypothetical protein
LQNQGRVHSRRAMLQQEGGKQGIIKLLNLEDSSSEHLAPS